MVECKNVRSEELAKCLDKITNEFRIWMHDNAVYALFDLNSLIELKELSGRLKRIKNGDFKYIKIRGASNYG